MHTLEPSFLELNSTRCDVARSNIPPPVSYIHRHDVSDILVRAVQVDDHQVDPGLLKALGLSTSGKVHPLSSKFWFSDANLHPYILTRHASALREFIGIVKEAMAVGFIHIYHRRRLIPFFFLSAPRMVKSLLTQDTRVSEGRRECDKTKKKGELSGRDESVPGRRRAAWTPTALSSRRSTSPTRAGLGQPGGGGGGGGISFIQPDRPRSLLVTSPFTHTAVYKY